MRERWFCAECDHDVCFACQPLLPPPPPPAEAAPTVAAAAAAADTAALAAVAAAADTAFEAALAAGRGNKGGGGGDDDDPLQALFTSAGRGLAGITVRGLPLFARSGGGGLVPHPGRAATLLAVRGSVGRSLASRSGGPTAVTLSMPSEEDEEKDDDNGSNGYTDCDDGNADMDGKGKGKGEGAAGGSSALGRSVRHPWHRHALKLAPHERGWSCDGTHQALGCRGSGGGSGPRYRCTGGCDFDLCEVLCAPRAALGLLCVLDIFVWPLLICSTAAAHSLYP